MNQDSIELFGSAINSDGNEKIRERIIELGCRAKAKEIVFNYSQLYGDSKWYSETIKNPEIMEELINKLKELF